MIIMSDFVERLKELLLERETSVKEVTEAVKIDRTTFYKYLEAIKLPSLKTAVLLSDYFACSLDYLLALSDDDTYQGGKITTPFSERLPYLLKRFGKTNAQLIKGAGLEEAAYYRWKNGQCQPNVESVVKLAEFLECSVDFIVGRGD